MTRTTRTVIPTTNQAFVDGRTMAIEIFPPKTHTTPKSAPSLIGKGRVGTRNQSNLSKWEIIFQTPENRQNLHPGPAQEQKPPLCFLPLTRAGTKGRNPLAGHPLLPKGGFELCQAVL